MSKLRSVGLFRFFALVFALAAAYHALPLIDHDLPIAGAHWRHGLFVVIDSVYCGLLWLRPRWLYIPLAFLTIYSLWSHGTHAWNLWRIERQMDWLSLVVIVGLPIILMASLRKV